MASAQSECQTLEEGPRRQARRELADEPEWEASMSIGYAIFAVEQAKQAGVHAAVARQEAKARKG